MFLQVGMEPFISPVKQQSAQEQSIGEFIYLTLNWLKVFF